MFVKRLFKNQNDDSSVVYVNMENIEGNLTENGDSVVIIDDQVDTTHRQNDPAISNKLTLKSSGAKYIDSPHVTTTVEKVDNESTELRNNNRRIVEGLIQEQNLPSTTPIKDVQEHLDPLVEYTEEPLLPLVEACVPLKNIIHDLSRYIRLALKETPNEPSDGLTIDESAAIRLYTIEWDEPHTSLYSMLNLTLKKSDRKALRPYFKYLKLLLTALVKLPCAPLQTVWRGVNKDLSKDFPRETLVTWWAFSSCTTSLTVLENNMFLSNTGDRTLFSVEAMNGRIVRAHSHYDFEDEILLLPGTYMEVHAQLSPAAGLHIIHLKQIKPIETLVALPFEGALLYPLEKKKVPWYKKKRTIGELSLLISLCIAGIIIGSVLGTRRSPPPPVCPTRSPAIKSDLFWSFDCGDAREDLKGVYNGTNENGANYSSPDFSGQGKALGLRRKLSQYVHLPHPLSLSLNTSFTVSAWVFLTGYNQATILSDCSPLNSVCIDLYVRSVDIHAEVFSWYDSNMCQSIIYEAWQVNYQSCWIHLTFTFDNQSNILSIYFNGKEMVYGDFSPSSLATTKTNESLTPYIGMSSKPDDRNPFDGLIDQLSISYYVKNDSEILDEATLLCSYNFEAKNINADSGPNNISAYSENVYRSLSDNQSNLLFNSTDSYFQTSGFTLLMSKVYEFTIAFWIRPIIMKSDNLNSAMAILQLASKVQQVSSSESYVCFLSMLIANITTDKPYFRFEYGELNMYSPLDWRVVQNDTWIHVAVAYCNASRLDFYLDGVLFDYIIDSRFSLLLYNPRLALTIGGEDFVDSNDTMSENATNYESRKCFAENPQFDYTHMNGEIDDLKVFARSLHDSEIAALAGV